MGETFLERERGKRQADVMPSRAFLLDFLEKKRRQQGKERGEEEGKEGKVMPLLLQGTMWEKPLRKGKGEETGGCHAFLCLLIGLP